MYNFKPGQRLVLELKNECYIGDFHNTNADCTRIELKNVQEFSSGAPYSGIQRYYRSEIQSVTPLKSDSSVTNEVPARPSSVAVTCLISAAELDTIRESIRSAQYFVHTDRAYYAAIEDIKLQSHIGLAVELVNETNVSLITVCVPGSQKIYIFDVISLGRIPTDLRAILQAKLPLKILHNCRAGSVALKREMNIQLQSIFDTLVSHVSFGFPKSASSLIDCLQTHLSFAPSLWIHNTDVNWLKRPLDDKRKKITAQNTVYLPRLYSFLLHERMLTPFYEQCNEFAGVHCVHKDELEEVFFDVCCNQNAGVRNIAPIELKFDGVAAELQQ